MTLPTRPDPVRIEWRVREAKGAYRLIDVAVEGVSLVVSNRSEFDSVVNRQGLDALIAQIRGKAESALVIRRSGGGDRQALEPGREAGRLGAAGIEAGTDGAALVLLQPAQAQLAPAPAGDRRLDQIVGAAPGDAKGHVPAERRRRDPASTSPTSRDW